MRDGNENGKRHDRAYVARPCHVARGGRATLLAGSAGWLPFSPLFAYFNPFSPLFAGFAWFNLLPARINKTSKHLKEYLINQEKL